MNMKRKTTVQDQDKDLIVRRRYWVVKGVVVFDRQEAVQTEKEK